MERERDQHNWFLSQKWVGMALYTNGFAETTTWKDLLHNRNRSTPELGYQHWCTSCRF